MSYMPTTLPGVHIPLLFTNHVPSLLSWKLASGARQTYTKCPCSLNNTVLINIMTTSNSY